jgi:hypothetical protein
MFSRKARVEVEGVNTIMSRSSIWNDFISFGDETTQSLKVVEWTTGRCLSETRMPSPCLDVVLFNYRNDRLTVGLSAQQVIVSGMKVR